MRGILPIIPPKSNRWEKISCDFRRYKDRNRIERMFGFIKHQRRIAIRYDKTALSFASFLNLAAIRRWLPHFVNTTSLAVMSSGMKVLLSPIKTSRQP